MHQLRILFTHEGGVDIGDVDAKAAKITVTGDGRTGRFLGQIVLNVHRSPLHLPRTQPPGMYGGCGWVPLDRLP